MNFNTVKTTREHFRLLRIAKETFVSKIHLQISVTYHFERFLKAKERFSESLVNSEDIIIIRGLFKKE